MQPNPFLEKMQAHPDAKLREIVTNRRSDYQPEAIEAAEFVLKQRNIDVEIPVSSAPEIKGKKSPVRTIIFKVVAPLVAVYLVGFAGKQTGIKPSYIMIGSISVLCATWFFFGIMKGKK